jgi:hypothetical protein
MPFMNKKLFNNTHLMEIAKFVYLFPYFLRKLSWHTPTFTFMGKSYRYFEQPYNITWTNERAIEIPIIWELVRKYPPKKVLEIGNVLSHYFPIDHIVVDKYETGKDIIKEDVVDINFERKFDCIVSISTLEHVGWDESPRTRGKHLKAVEILKNLLEPGGILAITIPLGYNPTFDEDLFSGKLDCTKVYYHKRANLFEWQEAEMSEVMNSRYGTNYRTTDGLAICFWEKPKT